MSRRVYSSRLALLLSFVGLIVLGSAVLLELAQRLTPDRQGRIQDAIIKMTGGILDIATGRAMLCFRREPLVPELTRSAGIQLNERVPLQRQAASY
jgi:VanZ family protein